MQAFPPAPPRAPRRPRRQAGFALPASSRSPAGSRETEAARRRERFREVSASGRLFPVLRQRGLGRRTPAGSPWTATCCGSRWAVTARRCCRCCAMSSKTTRTSGAYWARRPSQPAARRRLREPAGMGVVTRDGARGGLESRSPAVCGQAPAPGRTARWRLPSRRRQSFPAPILR